MTPPQEAYRTIVSAAGATLRPFGYRRRSDTFRRQAERNYTLVNFQRSRTDTRDEVKFTINVAAESARLWRFWRNEDLTQPPPAYQCVWQERIGLLLPQRQDHWWLIEEDTPLEPLQQEIQQVLVETAVPALAQIETDEKLRDQWLAAVPGGLSHYARLQNLLIVLTQIGPAELVPETLRAFEEEADREGSAILADSVLRRLGLR